MNLILMRKINQTLKELRPDLNLRKSEPKSLIEKSESKTPNARMAKYTDQVQI